MTGVAASAPPAAGGFLRRNRWGFLVGGMLLLAVVLSVVTQRDGGRSADPLDPRNPGPEGAQALAKVLEREGVDVTIVRSAEELDAVPVDPDTTVLVTGSEQLGPSTAEHLTDHAAPGSLVVVDPPSYVLDLLDPVPVALGGDTDDVDADCADPTYDDLTIAVASASAYEAAGCFQVGSGNLLVTARSGVQYFGAAEALTNDQVLRADNAAVALRLLGEHERLVWYVPSYGDTIGDEAVSLRSLLPPWIGPGLWLVSLAAIGLVLWRFRRLGPLSTEPLPVVVRAVETARSRGRMYRKGNDRAHAASVLRTAARRDTGDRLGLARGSDDAAVVAAVAHHTGRPTDDVAALISRSGPVPGTDRQLVHLAQELTRLTEEVRRG